jgi:cytidylate kinase
VTTSLPAGRDRRVSLALDGPAGAGKSSVARDVARRLGYTFIDTGAMYRAVAYRALRAGLEVGRDDAALGKLAGELRFEFRPVGDEQRLFVDGEDVEAPIRTPQVGNLSSPVSAIPEVRRHLVAAQQEMARGGGVVMEGRDIGTVVLPQAEVKVFLTASEQERARRRQAQLREQGVERDLAQILADQRERDERDSSRAVAPLRQAPDARLLVSDGLTQDEVVELIVGWVREAEAVCRPGACTPPSAPAAAKRSVPGVKARRSTSPRPTEGEAV